MPWQCVVKKIVAETGELNRQWTFKSAASDKCPVIISKVSMVEWGHSGDRQIWVVASTQAVFDRLQKKMERVLVKGGGDHDQPYLRDKQETLSFCLSPVIGGLYDAPGVRCDTDLERRFFAAVISVDPSVAELAGFDLEFEPDERFKPWLARCPAGIDGGAPASAPVETCPSALFAGTARGKEEACAPPDHLKEEACAPPHHLDLVRKINGSIRQTLDEGMTREEANKHMFAALAGLSFNR